MKTTWKYFIAGAAVGALALMFVQNQGLFSGIERVAPNRVMAYPQSFRAAIFK